MANRLTILLKLDGIDGEATAKGHEREITVLSYESVVDFTAVPGGGGGGAAVGKSSFAGVRFRKSADTASVPMLLACASGQHIRDARFTFCRSGGSGQDFDFYKVTLEDVLITHIAERAGTESQYPLTFESLNAGASNDGVLDEVTLNFAKIRWEHRVQRPDGSAGATTSGGWDLKLNRRF